jgi:hypothetical protein
MSAADAATSATGGQLPAARSRVRVASAYPPSPGNSTAPLTARCKRYRWAALIPIVLFLCSVEVPGMLRPRWSRDRAGSSGLR